MWDPAAKLDEYLAHRAERERKLVAALDAGLRGEDDAARRRLGGRAARPCARSPRHLRAHLEKLREEGREV